MKREFFIYSLPRSGSAWLSLFLSQPGSYCYHEPLADGGWSDLIERWESRPEPCVGAIDTSAHQRSPASIGVCKKYVLLREPREILASLRTKGYHMDLDMEMERLQFVTRDCIPIHYRLLHDLEYLEVLWTGITRQPFDAERTERLVEMNVQRTISSLRERLAMRR